MGIRQKHIYCKGSLLLEVIITIAILAVILSLGAQASFVSFMGTKMAGEKDTARSLAQETIVAVRSASSERWQNLYALAKGSSNHYFASTTSGRWTINNSGEETVVQNGMVFTRYFFIDNVSREPSSRKIEESYSVLNNDPSTQKITVVMTWGSGESLTMVDYVSRWRNRICVQTDWSGGIGSGVKNCPNTTYGSDDGHMNTSGGILKLQ